MADKKSLTEATGGTGETPAAQKPNKMEAMRQTLAELGDDAETKRIQAHLKQEFGVEMTTKHISTYRGDIIKKRQERKAAKKPAAKKPEPVKEEPAPVRAAPVAASNGVGSVAVQMEDVLAVRSLVDRVGARHLRTLIAAFER